MRARHRRRRLRRLGRRRAHASLRHQLRHVVQQRVRRDAGAGARTGEADRGRRRRNHDAIGDAADARQRVRAADEGRAREGVHGAAVPRRVRDRPDRAVEGAGDGDVFGVDAREAVERHRRRIEQQPPEQPDQNRQLLRGIGAAHVHRRIRLGEAEALRVGERRGEGGTGGHRGQDRIRGAVEDGGHAGGARRERAPLELPEERHAGDAAGFEAQRGGAAAGELHQLLAVRGDQRLVGGHDRDAAIERAPHEAVGRLDAAERFDDDVDRLGEKRLDVAGDGGDERGCRTRARGAAHEGGGHDRQEAARAEMRGGLARVPRERGADVTQAEEPDPARGRDALRLRDRRGAGHGVEHGRNHDERSTECAGDTRVPRDDPVVKSMRASGRLEESAEVSSVPFIGQELAPWL